MQAAAEGLVGTREEKTSVVQGRWGCFAAYTWIYRQECPAVPPTFSRGYSLTMPQVFEYVCAHFRGAEGGASAQPA